MGLYKFRCSIVTLLLYLASSSFLIAEVDITYLRHKLSIGNVDHVIQQLYESDNYFNQKQLLRDISYIILEQGLSSSNINIQIHSLYAASQTGDPRFIQNIKHRLLSYHPINQLAALRSLIYYNDSNFIDLVQKALSSPYLPIRIEALYILAQYQPQNCHNLITSLSKQLPKQARVLLPELYALEGSSQSIKQLNQLLFDNALDVRIAAAHAIGKYQITALESSIDKLMNSTHPALLESAIFATDQLNTFKKEIPISRYTQHSDTHLAYIRMQYNHEIITYTQLIEKAKTSSSPHLYSPPFYLENSNDSQNNFLKYYCRLMHNKPNTLNPLSKILSQHTIDWGFSPIFSMGKSLCYPLIIPSHRTQPDPLILPYTNLIRRNIITQASSYPRNEALEFYNSLIHLPDWTPLIISAIDTHFSSTALSLIKQWSMTPGNPYIRAWGNLFLLKNHIEGPSKERLIQWLRHIDFNNLFSFDAPTERSLPYIPISDTIQPKHITFLILNICNELIKQDPKELISILLEKLLESDSPTRYSLAGLLYKAAEV